MVHGRNCGVYIWAVSALLLAGCASYPTAPIPRASWEPPLRVGSPPKEAKRDVDQNRVQAYAHYVQGMIYDLDQRPDLAQEELVKAATLDPSNGDLVIELTRRYLRQKEPEKALGMLQRATAMPDASGILFAQLGLVYSHLGKQDAAIAACQNAIRVAPNLADGYRVLFLVQLQTGHNTEARKVLEQALKAPGPTPEFLVELVDLCTVFERQVPSEKSAITGRALDALNRAASQNPSDPHLRLRLAADYEQLDDVTNATKIYLQLLSAFGEMPALRADVHDKLAQIYLKQNDFAHATEQLEAIVQDNPADARIYSVLGSLAEEQKKLPEAETYFRKALILRDNVQGPYYELAQVQIDLNKPVEAIATLERARAKFPDDFTNELLSAQAYEKAKDFTNAITRYISAEVIAKATNPKLLNHEFYFFQGAACERAGEIDQAEKCFEKSLDLKPDSPETLNYLGYMWAEHDLNLDKALGLIEKALKLEPKSPAYLDSLGWVLYKLKRPQEALPNIQKAIELNGEPDATLYEHLGDVYAMLKQTDKARDAWTKSLATEPNDAVRKKLDGATGNSHPEKTPAKP